MSFLLEKLPFAIRMMFMGSALIFALYLDFGAALIACGATGYGMCDWLEWERKQQKGGS